MLVSSSSFFAVCHFLVVVGRIKFGSGIGAINFPPEYFYAHLHTPPDLTFPSLSQLINACAPDVDDGQEQPFEACTVRGNDREKEEKMDYISAKIWESDVKNQGTINKREDKREHFSL